MAYGGHGGPCSQRSRRPRRSRSPRRDSEHSAGDTSAPYHGGHGDHSGHDAHGETARAVRVTRTESWRSLQSLRSRRRPISAELRRARVGMAGSDSHVRTNRGLRDSDVNWSRLGRPLRFRCKEGPRGRQRRQAPEWASSAGGESPEPIGQSRAATRSQPAKLRQVYQTWPGRLGYPRELGAERIERPSRLRILAVKKEQEDDQITAP
jgi:hypothetical protein